MNLRFSDLASLLALVAIAVGCAPEIGDSCSTSTECSSQGDRLCDVTQPGGYCTKVGCEADTCPSEASCIAFHSVVSIHPDCQSDNGTSRLERTFCMRKCSKDADCRSGYECSDLSDANPWGATVVEEGQHGGKVCIVPASFDPELLDENDGAVCTGSDSAVPSASAAGGADAGGAAGQPASAGASTAGAAAGTAGEPGLSAGQGGAAGGAGAVSG